jgi:hypothetical protein
MTLGARLGRHQHQHRCCSIFVFFSVVVAEVSGRSAKSMMGYCGALTPGCTGSRTRAVLKSCITSLWSRESQGCPACTIVEWNVDGEMSRTRAARGPHSSHRTISASSTSPTGTPTHPPALGPGPLLLYFRHRHPLRRTVMSCGPCPCQCQRAQTAHGS